jgi:hypothetical protein
MMRRQRQNRSREQSMPPRAAALRRTLVRDLIFCISLVLGLATCGVVFRVASGASFDAYPIDKLVLIALVGGAIGALGLMLIGARQR